MSDTDAPSKAYEVRDPNNEQVKFVSEIANFGFINGVVNLTLLTCRYTPVVFPAKAEPDVIIGALLRFDLRLAQELHEALGAIIEQNTDRKLAS
jgi:hypothetical protein